MSGRLRCILHNIGLSNFDGSPPLVYYSIFVLEFFFFFIQSPRFSRDIKGLIFDLQKNTQNTCIIFSNKKREYISKRLALSTFEHSKRRKSNCSRNYIFGKRNSQFRRYCNIKLSNWNEQKNRKFPYTRTHILIKRIFWRGSGV